MTSVDEVFERRMPPVRRLNRFSAPFASADLRHAGSSAIGALFWITFAIVNIRFSIQSGRVIGLGVGLLGLWEGLLFCIRRPPRRVNRNLGVWIAAYLGTFGPSLLRPGGADIGWLDTSGLVFQGVGVAVGAASLAALGRSLGLVPAHRGLVTSGAYGVVRHPLYLSLLVTELGYVMQSPRPWNAAVLVLVWTAQVIRLLSEERLLSADAAYRAYASKTRWHLIPLIW